MATKLHKMLPESLPFVPSPPDLGPEWTPLLIQGVPLRAVGQHSAPRGQDFPPHFHHGLELVLYHAGHIVCEVLSDTGEQVQSLETFPGCVVLMPAGTLHADRALSAYQHSFVIFEPEGLPHWVQESWVTVLRDTPDRRLERLLGDLVSEWHGQAPEREEMVKCLLDQLRILLERLSKQQNISEAERMVGQVERILEERFSSNPSIRSLAEEVGVGYSSLREYFSRLRGYSPKAYLKQVRVRRALELIRSSSLTLEEVAGVTGFDSASHLWRDVKGATGQTPGDFRQGHILPGR
jgi:AraC-like DNA-binding protein